MTDERLDEALKDLRAELSVTPSPEFPVKVRERIEQAPAKSSWNVWAWAGVAATCAVTVIAMAMWLIGTQHLGGTQPATQAEAQPVVTAPTPALSQHVPIAPAVLPSARLAAVAPVHAAVRRTEPEVLVQPDQLIAIRRLTAAVRAGAPLSAPPTQVLFDPDTGELIPPKPIEIPPIVVDPLPGLPDGRSGGRENQ